MMATMPARRASSAAAVRWEEFSALQWLRRKAPCRWHGHVKVRFRSVRYERLQPASNHRWPESVQRWEERMRRGWKVPPLVVSETGDGRFYVHDGNHRYEALGNHFGPGAGALPVRVAVVEPVGEFAFRYQSFGEYATYVLRKAGSPEAAREAVPRSLRGRMLVLAAHPDDEVCAIGLMQRLADANVAYATDGAPADAWFWGRYGSRQAYAQVRRHEASAAMGIVGAKSVHFLGDYAERDFHDQELYRALPEALAAALAVVARVRPEALLVPAYEGGHPDHDACSYLGRELGRLAGIPVWEMPLYHRAADGTLVTRRFLSAKGSEVEMLLSPGQLKLRAAVVKTYASQPDLGEFLAAPSEMYRPQPAYDYSHRPCEAMLNYEAWQWHIRPEDLCAAMSGEPRLEAEHDLQAACRARGAAAGERVIPTG